jgi:hypothetical protein
VSDKASGEQANFGESSGDQSLNSGKTSAGAKPRPLGLYVIAVILLAQAALLAVAFVWLVMEALSGTESTTGAGAVLAIIALLAVVWLGASAVGLLRMAPWTRGSILAIEVFHAAIAIALFQGLFANPALGWALLAPALVAAILLFTKPVVAVTTRTFES